MRIALRKYVPMPIALQKYIIRKIFLKANNGLYRGVQWELDHNVDWNYLDSKGTLPENISLMERHYGQYRWRIPVTEREHRTSCWRNISAREDMDIYTLNTEIKRQIVRAKGKRYVVGRIQVTTDKKWIGCRAKITVFVRSRQET
jgi:hypothetical protein